MSSNIVKKNCKGQKRIYYNVSIPHNDRESKFGSPTVAKFSEARDEPLFHGKPCDWNMSVIRFTIPTNYIPIMYFPVEEDISDPTNRDKSIYSVTLTYQGNVFQEHLEWRTQDDGVPIPPPPTGVTEREFQYNPQYLEYYALYSQNHFCKLINEALDRCFQNNIVPLLPAGVYLSPYFFFDSETRLYSLVTSNLFLSDAVLPIDIYFNTYLYANFDGSFDVTYNDFSTPNGQGVKFNIFYRGLNQRANVLQPDGYDYIQKQEYDSTGQMQSFTSIIIRSTSLPIVNEAITLQPRAGTRNGTGIGSGSESIISDFELDLYSGKELKSFIHYNPTAEYRRITLQGETPITRMDISLFWKDNYDNLYPLLIGSHNIVTVKILFEENK